MFTRLAQGLAALYGSPAVMSLLLLSVAGLAPESHLIQTLKGTNRLDSELQRADTQGYYEELIQVARSAQFPANPDDDRRVAPPPGYVRFGAAGIVEEVSDYLHWHMRPNLDLNWNGVSFRTNRHGYRTPDFVPEKPEGTYRIVIFGSSNTMGHGVGDDAPYPRILESWLRARCPNQPIEVLNLAVSGESPSRRLARIQREAGRLHADWLLCDASTLDFSLEEIHLQAIVRSSPPIAIPFPFISQAIQRSGVAASDPPEAFRRKLRDQFEPILEGCYAGWETEARKLGIPLTVLFLPRADRKQQSPRILERMHAIARRCHLDVIDLTHAFHGLEPAEFRVAPWDSHPSRRGHQAIASALQTVILQRGGLPGLPLNPP